MQDARRALERGDADGAVRGLRRLLSSGRESYAATQAAGRLFWEAGARRDAVSASVLADSLDPLAAAFEAVRQAVHARQLDRAETLAHAMLERFAEHPRALYTLAHVARARRRPGRALELIDRGLALAPGNMILRHMRVGALEALGRESDALDAARELVATERSAASVLELGRLLQRFGRNEDLLSLFGEARRDIDFTPDQRGGMALVEGHALRVLGRADDAVAAYRRAIATNTPASLEAWWALSDLTTYRYSDAEVATLEAIVGDETLAPMARCQPAFGLAKAREASEGLPAAMDAFRRANALYRPKAFDAPGYLAAVGRVTAAWSPDALRTRADPDAVHAGGERPIFVLGMPRSGSTLLEQILASHPQIEGTHELPTLPTVKESLHRFCAERFGGGYLENIARIPQDRLEAAGRDYLRQSRVFRREGLSVFVDKMPQNFEHIGLIAKILPQASIIDIRRHPMACGLSLFRQFFASGWSWAYDLADIGAYYKGYLALMDHWHRVLPGRVLTLRYEDLVAETRMSVERVLDHVGLPFDEACLRFHETRRAVRTPSSEQVRQPVYRRSVDSWRAVEDQLAPLRAALGEEIVARHEKGGPEA